MLGAVLVAAGAFAGPTPPALADLDRTISFVAPPASEFFQLCQSLKLPCGIELDYTTYEDHGALVVSGLSGHKALLRVLSRYPGHRWRLEDGLLRVFPSKPLSGNPLMRRLPRVDFMNTPLPVIKRSLRKSIGIKPKTHSATSALTDEIQLSTASLSARDISARDALNAIVKSNGRAMWSVSRHKSGRGSDFYTLELEAYTVPGQTTRDGAND